MIPSRRGLFGVHNVSRNHLRTMIGKGASIDGAQPARCPRHDGGLS
jgi:hypothetical protein